MVPAASGCLLLIEHRLFDALGGFTPDYFMYSEDADFCARAARLGATRRSSPTPGYGTVAAPPPPAPESC